MRKCEATCVLFSHPVCTDLGFRAAGPRRRQAAKVIGSHMVLQRDRPLPIWGWADPGEEVTVTLGRPEGQRQGRRQGQLEGDAAAGEGRRQAAPLTVSGKNKIELDDILIGEVWLGSGPVEHGMVGRRDRKTPKEASAAANHPQIRLLPGPQGADAASRPRTSRRSGRSARRRRSAALLGRALLTSACGCTRTSTCRSA